MMAIVEVVGKGCSGGEVEGRVGVEVIREGGRDLI